MLTLIEMRQEFRPMLRLAVPMAMTELGWLLMGLVDTMMVGHLPDSAVAIGAVSLGTVLFYTIGIFGSSIMLGLDTLVSQAYGAGKIEECHRCFFNAIYFACVLAPSLMLIIFLGLPWLPRTGVDPAVLRETIPFIKALNWSTAPLVFYFVLRRYLQSMNIVKAVVFALVSANLVNIVGSWSLVYGHLGLPAMGVRGSGWSTCISRIYILVVLVIAVIWYDRGRSSGLWLASRRLEMARIRELLRLGMPAAFQLLLEISAFAVTTVFIGRLGALALAGHQIALSVTSLAYMVPLGIGSAAAIRVGHAIGGGDFDRAARAGWMALFFGETFMLCSALLIALFPAAIAGLYSTEPAVRSMGAKLLIVVAVFQIFDGMQTVVTGALRGAGNTHTPMLAHLVGYWAFGMPLGAWLCFIVGWGALGYWSGLCVALVLIGAGLLVIWYRLVRHWQRNEIAA